MNNVVDMLKILLPNGIAIFHIFIKCYFYKNFLGFKKNIIWFLALEISAFGISKIVLIGVSGVKAIFICLMMELVIVCFTCKDKLLVKIYSVMLVETALILTSFIFLVISLKLYPWANKVFIHIGSYKFLNCLLINFGDFLNELILFAFLKAICSILNVKEKDIDLYKQLYLLLPCVGIYGFALIFYSIQIIKVGNNKYYLPEIFTKIYYSLPFISLFLLFSVLVAAYTFQKMLDGEDEMKKRVLMQQQLNLQFEHSKVVQDFYKNTRCIMHDINNHINCLRSLAYDNNIEEIKNYLNNMLQTVKKLDFSIKTGNAVADAVINEKYNIAKNKKIKFDCDFILSEKMKIEPIDLSVILNNTLDNAIEACETIKNNNIPKFISIKSYARNSYLIIAISNSTEKGVRYVKNSIVSTKKDKINHGIGIYNIQTAVKKYNGTFDIKEEKNRVTINIMVSI